MESLSALFPFAIILLAFYLLIIRPARTRQRQAVAMQERLEPGVEIMTTSGIYGRVASVDQDSVMLEVAPGTTIRFAKAAVGRIVSDEDAERAEPAEPAPPAE